jgi:heparin binding hemagglutinin HbhA
MDMPITEDVRKAGEAFVYQGKAVLEDARKPLYAVLGAGDLAVARATTQLRELPSETQAALNASVKQARTRLDDLRADVTARLDDLRQRTAQAPSLAQSPTELRAKVEEYVGKALEFYADLARRGEVVATRLQARGAQGVSDVAGKVEDAADAVEDAAGDIEQDAGKTAASKRRSAGARKAASTRAARTTRTARTTGSRTTK